MKPIGPYAICIAVALAAGAAAATPLRTAPLADSEFADSETSTNCPFAFSGRASDWRFTLEFNATPSNNVEVAFGRDVDGDGVLSSEETGAVVGWDCGRWVCRSPSAVGSFEDEPAVTAGRRKLDWHAQVVGDRVRRLSVTADGQPALPALAADPPRWLYDPSWNAIRLTARGLDSPAERFVFRQDAIGLRIYLR